MTVGWSYGKGALDGGVPDPAAGCYSVAIPQRSLLEAENLILRQKLIVLRGKSASRVNLWNIDRLLFVWAYLTIPVACRRDHYR
jgi:hypothetical protein